jgi:hypothetical protein
MHDAMGECGTPKPERAHGATVQVRVLTRLLAQIEEAVRLSPATLDIIRIQTPSGELIPLSPTFSIGDRAQYRMFFDNLNSRFAGRENLTHLVMYKKMPGFIEGLTTEAAAVLRFDLAALAANTGNLNQAIYDAGSYIRLFYKTGGTDAKPAGASATFFPLDTDRFRLGYLYDISWGGTAAAINQSIFPRIQGSSPGLKLQFDLPDRFYAFAGFKTATIIEPKQVLSPGGENDIETVRVGETNFGWLGGVGVDATDNFRFDVGGGYFQQGKFDLEDVRGKNVYTMGGSARVVVHSNMPVPQSLDYLLYRNDPNKPQILFKPETYTPGKTTWLVSGEYDHLFQKLADFESTGNTKVQAGFGPLVEGFVRVPMNDLAAIETKLAAQGVASSKLEEATKATLWRPTWGRAWARVRSSF